MTSEGVPVWNQPRKWGPQNPSKKILENFANLHKIFTPIDYLENQLRFQTCS